jgi:hypothetical protein
MAQIKGVQMGYRLITGLFTALLVVASLTTPVRAHEEKNTHRGLTRAIFQLLQIYWDREGVNPTQRPTIDDINAAVEGSIREDDCPRYYSHFYNPNSPPTPGNPNIEGSNVLPPKFFGGEIDPFCDFVTDDPTSAIYFEQSTADARAAELWNCAIQTYRGFPCTETKLKSGHQATHQPGRGTAFGLLGRVLHLLEDMTSPAHVHKDPHGKKDTIINNCYSWDDDDFENWGWCPQTKENPTPDANHRHIRDYIIGDTSQGMTQYFLNNLATLFGQSPQGTSGSLDPVQIGEQNSAKAFVTHVGRLVYDFTTFKVRLVDDTNFFTDVQHDSELLRMLEGSTVNDCGAGVTDKGLCEASGGFWILGPNQDVGFSDGLCGSNEVKFDTREEWWPMDDGAMGDCTEVGEGSSIDLRGFAYIENTGGEGSDSSGTLDSFVPLKYGCDVGQEGICGGEAQSKRLFKRLYGSHTNHPSRTMLRIYGDILYSVAVAYGAGLVETFIEEVNKPIAVPGGPYTGEACQLITFDGSGSSDPSGGVIASYDWDFTADGSLDVSTITPTVQHGYPQPFSGQMRLRVTDNDGFFDDGEAQVTITPDRTPPNLAAMTATPDVLWPPNHQMSDVTINLNATDACGVAFCRIILVTSSEAPNGKGDGNTASDIEITGDLTLKLRAERSGGGNGRVYHVTVQCVDTNGNTATRTIAISAPRSNRQAGRR